MATKVIITEQYLKDIADAIREKGGQSLYTPAEMASAISHIHQGIDPEGTLEITENGLYDVTDKESVDVDVPNPSAGAIDIDENGNYSVRDYAFARVNVPLDPLVAQMNGIYDRSKGGYDHVTVSVPPYSRRTKTLAITENGTYNFKDDPTAVGEEPPATITVNVPHPATGTKNITQNGTYNIKDYATAEVNVPNPATGTKNITENGTHNIKDYEFASVDVPPYGEGTTTLVITDPQGTYDMDGYKYVEVIASVSELTITENGVYQPRYDQMILGYTKVTVNCPVPKIISFNNNWFHTTPEYGEDYSFEADNISMVDGRPSSMNPLSVGDKIVTTLDVENTFWMVRGTVKTITETTITVTLDHAEIIV